MNKDKVNKKTDYKKSLVRNTVQTKPKAVIIHEPELSDSTLESQKTSPKKQAVSEKSTDQSLRLGSPELNSALRIARKIESIEVIKPRKVKSISELDKKSSTVVTDKVTKQLNFPYNKPIYKDLIPLCVRTSPQVPIASKEFVFQKEKEPLLSDFFTPKTLPEYSFQVPQQVNNRTVIKQFDGLKLYRTMRNWN
ncbi:hypothetical protein ILUMI_06355 [Ignelater luminosus]|uniref:Protein phosphatase 1 regulatory subunit 35 C-terminal domain-containing protein n=1 Tax=Ignelater luminosus TaxID=2038154 RepID=A0A8K0D9E8_IGNLU|nr:hypothetical protein ILUMI_06355 [Ignelater luminosus]